MGKLKRTEVIRMLLLDETDLWPKDEKLVEEEKRAREEYLKSLRRKTSWVKRWGKQND